HIVITRHIRLAIEHKIRPFSPVAPSTLHSECPCLQANCKPRSIHFCYVLAACFKFLPQACGDTHGLTSCATPGASHELNIILNTRRAASRGRKDPNLTVTNLRNASRGNLDSMPPCFRKAIAQSGYNLILRQPDSTDAHHNSSTRAKQRRDSTPRFSQEVPIQFTIYVTIIAPTIARRMRRTSEKPKAKPLVFPKIGRIKVWRRRYDKRYASSERWKAIARTSHISFRHSSPHNGDGIAVPVDDFFSENTEHISIWCNVSMTLPPGHRIRWLCADRPRHAVGQVHLAAMTFTVEPSKHE